MKSVLSALAVTFVVLLAAVLAMAFRPLFVKGGKFPNTHIGASRAMRERGISCAASQDREARGKGKNKNK